MEKYILDENGKIKKVGLFDTYNINSIEISESEYEALLNTSEDERKLFYELNSERLNNEVDLFTAFKIVAERFL